MKFFDKLGLALFSIIVLVLAIVLCLIGFGWMEPTIFSILIGKVLISQTYTYIMIGVCIVFMLLAVKCLFFSDQTKKEVADDGILLQNEDGRLLITVETIKNMVEGVVHNNPNIVDSVTNVMINKSNDIIIDIEVDVTKDTIIKETTSNLQMQIKKIIKEATDLDIKFVNVRIRNAEMILNQPQVMQDRIKIAEQKLEKMTNNAKASDTPKNEEINANVVPNVDVEPKADVEVKANVAPKTNTTSRANKTTKTKATSKSSTTAKTKQQPKTTKKPKASK